MAARAQPRMNATFQTVTGADNAVYRRTVQVILVDQHNRLLVFTPVGKNNGSYVQPIQGGIEADETPMQAAIREAREEAGLDIVVDAEFVGEIQPATKYATDNTQQTDEQTHKQDLRSDFRYSSKSWRHYGVKGQEICPLLFHVNDSIMQRVKIKRSTSTCRQEFVRAQWCTLDELVQRTAPRKQKVMNNICSALAMHNNMQLNSATRSPQHTEQQTNVTKTIHDVTNVYNSNETQTATIQRDANIKATTKVMCNRTKKRRRRARRGHDNN